MASAPGSFSTAFDQLRGWVNTPAVDKLRPGATTANGCAERLLLHTVLDMNREPIPNQTQLKPQPQPFLGIGILGIIGLALLGTPRVVLHDLDVIHEGTFINLLFVVMPLLVWFAVVYAKRVRTPFLTLLAVGMCYGILIVLIHQMLWNVALEEAPQLGGNLEEMSAGAQEVIIRSFSVVSGFVTGTIVGAIVGLISWAIMKVTGRIPK